MVINNKSQNPRDAIGNRNCHARSSWKRAAQPPAPRSSSPSNNATPSPQQLCGELLTSDASENLRRRERERETERKSAKDSPLGKEVLAPTPNPANRHAHTQLPMQRARDR